MQVASRHALNKDNFVFEFDQFLYVVSYLMVLLLVLVNLPQDVWKFYESRSALISFGLIGAWRYSWWVMHVVRSLIYGKWVFPQRRLQVDEYWNKGWRPDRVFIMMTTFNELQPTTEQVLNSIVHEAYDIQTPVYLFVGIGSDYDERIITEYFAVHHHPYVHYQFVRQTKPGKRYAISDTLRKMIQFGLKANDPVVFMDGDTYFELGCLRKCLPFFPLYPALQALTTYERACVLNGPSWVKKFLELRFAQRDFTMQSYALSNKILTLTGRMSIFLGKYLLEPAFLEVIENDHLTHWLWGRFRFLSGDDKSTWYYLLKSGADMFYIPDAKTMTIEYIHGNPFNRMFENLRRWSGNTLRNGARAMALGPKKVGFFIWWCLVDQRISIWTMFAGHSIMTIFILTKSWAYLWVALLWIAFSRFNISLVLFYYARRIDITFPFLLYLNQIMTTVIKIYIIFRLPQQKWKNRGDQRAGFDGNPYIHIKSWIASYLTLLYCLGFMLLVMLYLDIVYLPHFYDIFALFF